jgi:cardiolipin synthase
LRRARRDLGPAPFECIAGLPAVRGNALVPLIGGKEGFACLDELREAGVQIWRYRRGVMHRKVVLVDDSLAAMGTSNLDNRSLGPDFEAMVVRFAADVARFPEADFADAALAERPLSEQSVRVRQGAPAARLFAPLP